MPNVGPMELLLLGILAVVIFGPAKLPEIGRSIGRATREFKDTISGTGIDDAINGVSDVRSAMTPTNLAKAAMPAPVKEMAAGVTDMKETFTDPLGMKKRDEAADGEEAAEDGPATSTAPAAGTAPAAALPAPVAAASAPEAPVSPQP
jgi:TatA/E family protein of Tat protein translocase